VLGRLSFDLQYGKSVRHLAVVMGVGFLTGCANSARERSQEMPEVAKWSPLDKKRGFESYVRARAGAGATSCGTYLGSPYLSGRRVSPEQLREISACLSRSREAGKPFFFAIEGSTADSRAATGLLSRDDDSVELFWYDSNPCGGPGCDERFSTYRCPPSQKSVSLDPMVRCGSVEMQDAPKE
jgi:hypothetical protein